MSPEKSGPGGGVNEYGSARKANGKFTIIKVDPIPKEQERIIRDIVKWEDESAKSDFVISPRRLLSSKED
jgi:hypothetical protein